MDKIAGMGSGLPKVKEDGGYTLSSDHSVPYAVSPEDFYRIVDLAKRLGSHG